LEGAHGRDHPHTIGAVLSLARLRKNQGWTAEALALYQRALDPKERTGAPDDPELAEIRESIAALRTTERAGD
jgi:hypothetical protein